MDGKSTAQTADTQFAWLRTIIPMTVIRQLKIRVGDKLDWEFCFWVYPKFRNTTKGVREKKK